MYVVQKYVDTGNGAEKVSTESYMHTYIHIIKVQSLRASGVCRSMRLVPHICQCLSLDEK